MRYLRAIGVIASLAVLLAGFALGENRCIPVALYVLMAGGAVGALVRPSTRMSALVAGLCAFATGLCALALQTDANVFVLHGAAGDTLLPAGENAYRSFGACLWVLLAGCQLGAMGAEAAFARAAEAPAAYAAFPVRLTLLLLAAPGLALPLMPMLGGVSTLWAVSPNAKVFLEALCLASVAAYAASSRWRAAGLCAVLVYLAASVLSPELFAKRALLSVVLCAVLCARGDGYASLALMLPVPAALLAILFADIGGAFATQAAALDAALGAFLPANEMDWMLGLYARLGYIGVGLAGAFAGALCFFCGRLLRESFLYAAAAAVALAWGCYTLYAGLSQAPGIAEGLAFLCVYGICLIVGTVRRAKRSARRERRPARRKV